MVEKGLLSSLDRDGYAVVRGAVPMRTVDELRRWVDELVDADLDVRIRDARRRQDAGERDARAFAPGFEGRVGLPMDDHLLLSRLDERVVEIVRAIGTPRRGNAGIAACLPGWGGHDGLHQDLPGSAPEIGRWDGAVLTFPMSAWEGMRVIPGSHRRDPVFGDGFASAVAPHPGEVHVEAGPGDVVVNSIHVYKSITLNRSTERRSEIWVGYADSAVTSSRVAAYWTTAEIQHGEVPVDLET